jgi:hypothetical protein
MTTAVAVQCAVMQFSIGLTLGGLVEGVLPTTSTETSSVQLQIVETLVQIGLNGAVLGLLPSWIRNDDPTCGIPFAMGLASAQPELEARIRSLGGLIRHQVSQGVQRMVPPVPAV